MTKYIRSPNRSCLHRYYNKPLKQTSLSTKPKWLITCILLAALIASTCAYNPVVGRRSYNFFTLTDDIVYGTVQADAAIDEFQSKGHAVDKDTAMTSHLNTMVLKIAAVSHMPELPWEVHYVEMDVPNAFAYPGGEVFVLSGLMDPKEGLVDPNDDDALAMVMGHEMAHATARHGTERMSKTVTTVAVAESLSIGAQAAAEATGSPYYPLYLDTFDMFLVLGVNLLVPSYSRSQEYEADRIGMSYAAKAGYNPEAAIRIWTKAARKSGPEYSIFSTHPSNMERVNELKIHLPQAQNEYNMAKKNPAYWASLSDQQASRPANYRYEVARAHTIMGNAYADGAKYEQAKTQYYQALAISPRNSTAHTGLGFTYLADANGDKQGYQKAEKQFLEALRYNPNSSEALYGLGLVYSRTGNRQGAVDIHNRLLYSDPELANRLKQEL